jgi:hypothetical protein
MSHGRHAKPRPPRSDAPVLVLVVLLAAGVAAMALLTDGLGWLRAAIAALALLCVVAVVVSRRAGRRRTADLEHDVAQRSNEVRALRMELERVHVIHYELADEVVRMREQMAEYVVPVAVTPDPVYPSLHLPLVRAAFAEELPPAASIPKPRRLTERSNVEVQADPGSDAMPPRQILDLTASEIARMRRASSA